MARIVVLGAGYAGVQTSRALARMGRRHDVVLVDKLPYHQLITQLPAIAAGRLPPARAAIPLHRIIPSSVRIVQAEVTAVAAAPSTVSTSLGPIQADWIAIALGGVASDLGVPGVVDHAYPLKSVRDAERIAMRLTELRSGRALTRVVIVGGGYTGSETAGELTDPSARHRGPGSVTVTIVQPDSRLLPQGDGRLAAAVTAILRRRGVGMLFDAWIEAVEQDRVRLVGGEHLPADMVIWAARAEPARAIRTSFDLTVDGRIRTDPYLRVSGEQRTYAAGDVAGALDYLHGTPLPASAQVAVPQGERMGENIAASLEGRRQREFRERLLGEALALGGREGAAEVAGVIATGRLALGVKRAALLRYLGRFQALNLVRDYG